MFLPKFNGVFSVVKPRGMTCAKLVKHVRNDLVRELGITEQMANSIRIKHGVRLHEEASGVVILGLGRGINLLPTLIRAQKRYTCSVCLGESTSNYHTTGKTIEEKPYKHITVEYLKQKLGEYTRKLKLAKPRKLLVIDNTNDTERKGSGGEAHPINDYDQPSCEVHELLCNKVKLPEFTFDILTSGSFYITSFVDAVSKDLGTVGHISELHRSQDGPFNMTSAIPQFEWSIKTILAAVERFDAYHLDFYIEEKRHRIREKKNSKTEKHNDVEFPKEHQMEGH